MDKIAVTRNSITREFVQTSPKKGKNKDSVFFAVPVKLETLDEDINFIGREEVASILNAQLRLRSKGWSGEAEDEALDKSNGQIDEAKYALVFSTMAADFSARGETIKELQGKIDELVEEITGLDYGIPESIARAQAISTEIKKLQVAMQSKRRTKDEEEVPAAA